MGYHFARAFTNITATRFHDAVPFLSLVIPLMILFSFGDLARIYAQDGGTKVKSGASSSTGPSRAPQTFSQDGIAVEFSIEPIGSVKAKSSELMTETEATVRFRVAASEGGTPLSNLRPTAWIDRRQPGHLRGTRECREKVQSFLQSSFSKRADIDLNSYFILTLNHEPNISVIDPFSGFGGSKLYTLVSLLGPGYDWVIGADKKRVYVSMPQVNKVAVIDTATWKVVANLDAGINPARVVLQNDGKYLWVGNDDPKQETSGVTVIETVTLKVAARINTGAGHHEIVITNDDKSAFITNRGDGTLSVIDVGNLVRVKDIKIGSLPTGLAFSSLSRAVYVANEGDGAIVVVDGVRFEVLARMKGESGLRAIRIEPEGRLGFAVNSTTNTVSVFDLASNRLLHTVPVGPAADQIAFTRQFAYVRSTGDEFVNMIKLADLGKEAAVTRFPAGERAPKESGARSLADAIVPAPEEGAVLVANPADKMIYYYTEGMAAPMGSFQNYRRDPKALLVLDNGLVETGRGIYTTVVRLPKPGNYDVAFLLDSPRLVNCFDLTVAENPALAKPTAVAIKVESLVKEDAVAHAGESFNLRFKLVVSNSPAKVYPEDVGVLVFLAPGIWQQRQWAKSLGEGVYETSFVPPQAGIYYVYFQCPSLGVRFNHITPLTFQASQR
jgi:YVTN family beta-propeller protein